MVRWEPDARGRLLHAALDLFAERGYEATTAAQLAAHAGLTKTTLFRLFADKREVLFQGQPALVTVAAEAVRTASADASPLEAMRAGVRALVAEHVPEQQEIGRRIDALIATSSALQERAAFKRAAITAALRDALVARCGDVRLSGALADIGARAYYDGFSAWIDSRPETPLVDVVDDELAAIEHSLAQTLITTEETSSTSTVTM